MMAKEKEMNTNFKSEHLFRDGPCAGSLNTGQKDKHNRAKPKKELRPGSTEVKRKMDGT